MEFNIEKLGATGRNIEEDTIILQRAIDDCSKFGGKVIIPRGKRYTINGISLKSNVELHLEKNSCLRGSGDENLYIKRPGPFERIKNNTPIHGLIFGKDLENIKITGSGSIDGNYKAFIYPNQDESVKHLKFYKYPRPMTVYLENCNNTEIKDIYFFNAPFWTVHLVGCNKTYIEHVTINNEQRMPNTDGFDIDRCKNTKIFNCDIKTGDDAICPKCTEETYKYGDCKDLEVKNCKLTSASSAIKFGSSSFGKFINCSFKNIIIKDSNRGLALQLRDTDDIENILFKDISISTNKFSQEWWGNAEPIYITACKREKTTNLGHIRNISFKNIKCVSENGIFIYTDTLGHIENISFDNIEIELKKKTTYKHGYDLRPCEESERINTNFSPIYAENTINIVLRNLKIYDREDFLDTKKYIFKNCKNVFEI